MNGTAMASSRETTSAWVPDPDCVANPLYGGCRSIPVFEATVNERIETFVRIRIQQKTQEWLALTPLLASSQLLLFLPLPCYAQSIARRDFPVYSSAQ